MPVKVSCGRQGMLGLAQLFDSHHELLPLVGPLWLYVCRVVMFYLTRTKFVQISLTLSKMSDTYMLQSFCSNATFITLCMYQEMDVNYLIVIEVLNINVDSSQFHVYYRLQTYDINYLNMAKMCLKVIKVNCCRLMRHCHLKTLHV
jgi:hypothetical protein